MEKALLFNILIIGYLAYKNYKLKEFNDKILKAHEELVLLYANKVVERIELWGEYCELKSKCNRRNEKDSTNPIDESQIN